MILMIDCGPYDPRNKVRRMSQLASLAKDFKHALSLDNFTPAGNKALSSDFSIQLVEAASSIGIRHAILQNEWDKTWTSDKSKAMDMFVTHAYMSDATRKYSDRNTALGRPCDVCGGKLKRSA
jgi:hypothetical protein